MPCSLFVNAFLKSFLKKVKKKTDGKNRPFPLRSLVIDFSQNRVVQPRIDSLERVHEFPHYCPHLGGLSPADSLKKFAVAVNGYGVRGAALWLHRRSVPFKGAVSASAAFLLSSRVTLTFPQLQPCAAFWAVIGISPLSLLFCINYKTKIQLFTVCKQLDYR